MAYTDIDKPSDYFNTKLYTGNGGTLSVTGLDFQPDFSWLKCRGVAYNHRLYDVIRTPLDSLQSNSTAAESADGDGLSAFNSDGFTVTQGGNTEYNNNAVAYASWNWKAGGSGSANTDGQLTSSVSVNQDAGFSIVSYTGTGANATVGHGLGSAPKMMIIKNRDSAEEWGVYHVANGNTHVQYLNTTNAKIDDAGFWNDTTPTSSVFTVGNSSRVNQNESAVIAYCFADVKGYSKFGSYTGNSSTDGTFVYTGFSPSFLMIKCTSGTEEWWTWDNKRDTYNVVDEALHANSSDAVEDSDSLDFLSNGFKMRVNSGARNATGSTYIYMAFASEPFTTSTGIPCTAR